MFSYRSHMAKWTYTREYDAEGDWLANSWFVKRDGQTVAHVRYVNIGGAGGDSAYTFRLTESKLFGHAQSLPDALNAVRDALS